MSKFAKWLLIILAWLNLLLWIEVFEVASRELEVTFFDVGEGDSIFIETPAHHQVLVDGGPDKQILLSKIGDKLPFWDRSLDVVVLTHPDRDHLAGLLGVLDAYQVDTVLWTGVVKDTQLYRRWVERLQKEDCRVIIAHSDTDLRTFSVYFDIVSPLQSLNRRQVKETNDSSVVMRVDYQTFQFLLTGDISQRVENKLVQKQASISSDFLKVAHHGSRSSTGLSFLKWVDPRLAVISVGEDNMYGHPHQSVLSRLASQGIPVRRTDQQGDITISINNHHYSVR